VQRFLWHLHIYGQANVPSPTSADFVGSALTMSWHQTQPVPKKVILFCVFLEPMLLEYC
jgi:hypothetical protein